MIDPIFGVVFPVQCCALDADVFVGGIKIDGADGGGFAALVVGDADGREEGGREEVDVLAGVGEDAEHGEGDEGAHCY